MHGNKQQQAKHATLRLGKNKNGTNRRNSTLCDLQQNSRSGTLTLAKSHKLPENMSDHERQARHVSRCAYSTRAVKWRPQVMFRGSFGYIICLCPRAPPPYTQLAPSGPYLHLTLLLRAYFFTVLCTETACCAGKDGVPVMICYTLQPILNSWRGLLLAALTERMTPGTLVFTVWLSVLYMCSMAWLATRVSG